MLASPSYFQDLCNYRFFKIFKLCITFARVPNLNALLLQALMEPLLKWPVHQFCFHVLISFILLIHNSFHVLFPDFPSIFLIEHGTLTYFSLIAMINRIYPVTWSSEFVSSCQKEFKYLAGVRFYCLMGKMFPVY